MAGRQGWEDPWERVRQEERQRRRQRRARLLLGQTVRGRIVRVAVVMAAAAAITAPLILASGPSGPPSAASGIGLTTPGSNGNIGDIGIGDTAFSPDGTLLTVGGFIWDASSGKFLTSMHVGSDVLAVAITRDDKSVIAASRGGGVQRFSIATGVPRTQIASVPGASYSGASLALSGDGSTLALIDGAGADVWDVATGTRIAQLRDPDNVSIDPFARDAQVLLDADGGRLAIADPSGHIYVWDTRHATVIRALRYNVSEQDQSTGYIDTLSPDGKALLVSFPQGGPASGRYDAVISVDTGADMMPPRSGWHGGTWVLFSANGKVIAASDQQPETLALWNLPKRKLAASYSYDDGRRQDGMNAEIVAISPDGTRIVISGAGPGTYIFPVPGS